MEAFVDAHKSQLQQLNISEPLWDNLQRQLVSCFVMMVKDDDDEEIDHWKERLATAPQQQVFRQASQVVSDNYGSIIVMPHICSWDMQNHRGMWEALSELSDSVLICIWNGLQDMWESNDETTRATAPADRDALLNKLCEARTWSRVILYRRGNQVRAALPSPPYYPQVQLQSENDPTEADLTGPFPFRYHLPSSSEEVIDTSLAYLSPGVSLDEGKLPTIDLCPAFSCPNALTRAVRYVALLGQQAPAYSQAQVKEIYSDFVRQMHLVRQEKLQQEEVNMNSSPINEFSAVKPPDEDKVWNVFTDANDPMRLADPEAGLTDSHFAMTESIDDADIVYSYHSLFAPGELRDRIERRSKEATIFINQFPYEGCLVQKDHLGREILRQHGLPRPSWALETYDLDVQLAQFVGAALMASSRGEEPLWIVKPAALTQSKGHLITKSTAHILHLVDAGGESRVAQRYVESPVCVDGRKMDCRCLVMMVSATPGRPTLYMYKRVFFRQATKKHSIAKASDLIDNESVLTAIYLLDEKDRSSSEPLPTLPTDYKIIEKLEEDYGDRGFIWKDMEHKLHNMIRELFNGMTRAFPAMADSKHSRALYGVDVMFQIEADGITPKLTEVTFCPSNNATSDAYERDETLYRSYNNDIFNCLFRGVISDRITKLQ